MAPYHEHMQHHQDVLENADRHFPPQPFDNSYQPRYDHRPSTRSHRDSVSSFGSSQSAASSSVFDTSSSAPRRSGAPSSICSSSVSEAPPTHSSADPLDQSLMRRWQPAMGVPFDGEDIPHFHIPCEFRWYGNCAWLFPYNDMEGYVQHITTEHLKHKMPQECRCWWCDKFSFKVGDPSDKSAVRVGGQHEKYSANHSQHRRFSQTVQIHPDAPSCFKARMDHIASHISDGEYSPSDGSVRPDHPMLHHLAHNGLIEAVRFEEMKNISEMPRMSGHDVYPEGWRPERHPREMMVKTDLPREERARRKRAKGRAK